VRCRVDVREHRQRLRSGLRRAADPACDGAGHCVGGTARGESPARHDQNVIAGLTRNPCHFGQRSHAPEPLLPSLISSSNNRRAWLAQALDYGTLPRGVDCSAIIERATPRA